MQELKGGDPEVDERLKLRDEGGEDRVPIMTTFGSKGLEFDVVFALGMACRHYGEEFDEEKEAEKMRQLYVAFTRPREKLYIPIIEGPPGGASPIERFFQEMPENIFRVGKIPFQKYRSTEEKIVPNPPKYLGSFRQ